MGCAELKLLRTGWTWDITGPIGFAVSITSICALGAQPWRFLHVLGVGRAVGGCRVCVPVFAAFGSLGAFRLWYRDHGAGWRALGGFGRVAETSEMLGRFILFPPAKCRIYTERSVVGMVSDGGRAAK